MKQTSKTGLTASPTKTIHKNKTKKNVQLRAVVKPAPFILKPFAGLYNPYADGCSLLCNHPMDKDTKELFLKAKENWTNDDKRHQLLAEEIAAIRANLQDTDTPRQVESVPEELFRRYTDTDSRPLTPAPTLASAATHASGSRRCFTPELRKTQLVLDLRRSHSQETIPCSVFLNETPLIRIEHVPTRTISLENFEPHNSPSNLSEQSPRKVKTAAAICAINFLRIKSPKGEIEDKAEELNEEDDVKRRGKRRKKKNSLRGPPAFQMSSDPETQVAAIGMDSANRSARTSLIPISAQEEKVEVIVKTGQKFASHKSIDANSFLDAEILMQIRRELNEEIVDSELNPNRRQALEEALKSVAKDRPPCQELLNLQKELKVAKLNSELWISLPRTFTRSSARFELPMSSHSLLTMTPLQYVQEHVKVSSERKLLFNCVFNTFKTEGTEIQRILPGHRMQDALDLLMGRPMRPEEAQQFRNFIDWSDQDCIDFRTFCGIAALCERLMAPFYCDRLVDRKRDPCQEIETADFETLVRKINGQVLNDKLVQILNEINTR